MKLIFGGVDRIPGYTSIDLRDQADVVHDIRLRWPFESSSAEVVYGSHILEHLTQREGQYCIRECNRVLEPGGILRLSVPDLYLFAEKYVHGDGEFYGQATRDGRERFVGRTLSEKFMFVVSGQGHKYQYDFDSLSLLLRQCGFDQVERKQYRESDIPEIDLLDNRPEQSLFIEARKAQDVQCLHPWGCVSAREHVKMRLHLYSAKLKVFMGRHFPFLKRVRKYLWGGLHVQR
jgi:predicted SAM-dependent methyltransferase